ncbi:hypothetical protein [Methanobacterium alcaliphilum]|uniref:hypothetical protein n=1 Tax=Methanobacterium alcaliphilum TaxID=392018 RepID=UPI00200B80E3|nr:hypothetical protein [Methanobacterium alcaliphilum]MCK9151858.1 hypothetical protein [Methanobacterium alcaliphilum]
MSFFDPRTRVSPWKKNLLKVMRLTILVLGILIVVFGVGGTKVFGLMALLGLGLIYLPTLTNKNHLQVIPVEIEILFLLVLVFEYVLGNTFGLYGLIPHYDKFMHFAVPLIVALIGMMFMYTAYVYGKIKTSLKIMAFLIVLITIGIGGILEMVEYTYDTILYQHIEHFLPTGLTQGSPTMSPLDDTMIDLFTDALGGIAGAIIGILLIKRAQKKGQCSEWVDEFAEIEGFKKNKK